MITDGIWDELNFEADEDVTVSEDDQVNSTESDRQIDGLTFVLARQTRSGPRKGSVGDVAPGVSLPI